MEKSKILTFALIIIWSFQLNAGLPECVKKYVMEHNRISIGQTVKTPKLVRNIFSKGFIPIYIGGKKRPSDYRIFCDRHGNIELDKTSFKTFGKKVNEFKHHCPAKIPKLKTLIKRFFRGEGLRSKKVKSISYECMDIDNSEGAKKFRIPVFYSTIKSPNGNEEKKVYIANPVAGNRQSSAFFYYTCQNYRLYGLYEIFGKHYPVKKNLMKFEDQVVRMDCQKNEKVTASNRKIVFNDLKLAFFQVPNYSRDSRSRSEIPVGDMIGRGVGNVSNELYLSAKTYYQCYSKGWKSALCKKSLAQIKRHRIINYGSNSRLSMTAYYLSVIPNSLMGRGSFKAGPRLKRRIYRGKSKVWRGSSFGHGKIRQETRVEDSSKKNEKIEKVDNSLDKQDVRQPKKNIQISRPAKINKIEKRAKSGKSLRRGFHEDKDQTKVRPAAKETKVEYSNKAKKDLKKLKSVKPDVARTYEQWVAIVKGEGIFAAKNTKKYLDRQFKSENGKQYRYLRLSHKYRVIYHEKKDGSIEISRITPHEYRH